MFDDETPRKETLEEWHKDPSNWVWGVFYYNKKDKRILVSKRLSYLGWTINFANPVSILIFAAVIIAIALSIKLS